MRRILHVAVLGVMVLGFNVMAGAESIPPMACTITASSSVGSDSFTVPAGDWFYEEYTYAGKNHKVWSFDLDPSSPIVLTNSSQQEIGRVTGLSLAGDVDPMLSDILFVCVAGSADTTFTLTSALNIPAMTNPDAQATASITATDDSINGVTLGGSFAGGKCYQARYNSPSAVFATLVDGGSGTGGESYSNNETKDWTTLGTTVDKLESVYQFTLSAGDSASGTSNFQLVPEPASLAFLALAAVGLLRKRHVQ